MTPSPSARTMSPAGALEPSRRRGSSWTAAVSRRRRLLACVAVFLTWPVLAAAQQTRVEEHEQAQRARAAETGPSTDNVFEKGVRKLKSFGLFGGTRDGFYPQITTAYPGGWLAFGGGYRRPLGDSGSFDVGAAWSLRNFKRVDAAFVVPTSFAETVSLQIDGHWIDAPEVAFYGLGNQTRAEDETAFAYRPTSVGVTVSSASWDTATLAAGLDLVMIDAAASDAGAPITPATPIVMAGVAAEPRYLRSRGLAQLDWRDAPGYSGRGGLYRLEVMDYADRSASQLSFRSVEAEAVQLIPILNANWVIALRGLATVTDARNGHDVPFYLMPSIGGNSSVRGYSSLRFRGNHRLLMSAEYRWTATRYMDMALFYDTGKVEMRLEDLDFNGLKSAYGIGARFHGTRRTVFRIEGARNDEGSWRFLMSTGAAF